MENHNIFTRTASIRNCELDGVKHHSVSYFHLVGSFNVCFAKKKMKDLVPHRRMLKGRRRSYKDDVSKALHDFGMSTSLHGVKRIIDDFNYLNKSPAKDHFSKRYTMESDNIEHILSDQLFCIYRKRFVAKFAVSIIWIGSFLIGITLLVLLNVLFWQRKQAVATLTTIDTYYHPIYAVPFPAVTLCNINVVHRPSLQWFIDKL